MFEFLELETIEVGYKRELKDKKEFFIQDFEGRKIKVEKEKHLLFHLKDNKFPFALVTYYKEGKWQPFTVWHIKRYLSKNDDICSLCGEPIKKQNCSFFEEQLDDFFRFLLNQSEFRFKSLSEFPKNQLNI